MAQEMVEYPSNGDTASGYLSTPAAGPGPGLVVVQEWWGLSDQIKRTADRFAEAGFSALVPDLYHGHVVGIQEPDQAAKAAMALDASRAARDLRGAVEYLLGSGAARGDRVGCVGYCMGGGLAVTLATVHDRVLATVDFYGIPGPDADLGRIQGPLLGHFGDQDDYAAPAAVQDLDRRLAAAGVTHEFFTYQGADHAFTNEDRPEVHHPEADRLSWERTLGFLRRELVR
ncbi:MAG: dienelactone hydrolase family protein [Candidatus Dormibacteria bacterium]